MPNDTDSSRRPVTVLVVAYDGEPFSGFARQPGLATVQGCVEEALATALRRPVLTVGAGRTDAGVHALGQVMSFESAEGDLEPARLRRSLEALTPDGVAVRDVRVARPGFSARFDAQTREYRYRITTGATPPLFLRHVAWHVPKDLHVEAMLTAASALVGEHDFMSFCTAESAQEQRTTMRRLDLVDIAEEEQLGEACLTVRVVGNAFLHSMVRVIVGSLVEVGSDRRDAAWVGEALLARTRSAAGPTAPAHGLTLWKVGYPKDVWL